MKIIRKYSSQRAMLQAILPNAKKRLVKQFQTSKFGPKYPRKKALNPVALSSESSCNSQLSLNLTSKIRIF
jgi:hypothetical protein